MAKHILHEPDETAAQRQAYRELLEQVENIRARAHEQAGAAVFQIFTAAREEVELSVRITMSSQDLGGLGRARFLRRLLSDLETRHSGMDFASDQIQRMLRKK